MLLRNLSRVGYTLVAIKGKAIASANSIAIVIGNNAPFSVKNCTKKVSIGVKPIAREKFSEPNFSIHNCPK